MVAFSRMLCTFSAASLAVNGLVLLKPKPAKEAQLVEKDTVKLSESDAAKKKEAQAIKKLRAESTEAILYGRHGCVPGQNICESCEEICNIGKCNIPGVWAGVWAGTKDHAESVGGTVARGAKNVLPHGAVY